MTKINKTERVVLRCTKMEKKIIENFAKKSGLTISEYCRKQARNGKVLAIPKLDKQEIEYLHLLKSYGANFNRLSNLIKQKDPSLIIEIRLLVQELTNLQKRIIG